MAAPVTALQPLQLPAGPSAVTAEQRYWRSFRSQQLIPSPHSNPVTHISSPVPSPSATTTVPLDVFAVTSGGRIQLFSTKNRKVIKTITRFGVDDVAHSGEVRHDGRVLVAGGDSGGIQVFDTNSRAILKTWKEHKQPVWTTKWSPADLTTLMSTSDDRTVRLWDLPSMESVRTFTGHQDYVRSGCFMAGQNSNLLVTGSYDQTVRLWDPRVADGAVMTFRHAAPVESVLSMASGMTILASADNAISVLDLVAARPLEVLRSHQKTVTAMALASDGTRLVSGGLDGHVKIFDTSSWTVVAGSKYPSPILSLSVIRSSAHQEDRHLAVGMQSGLLSLKTRLSGQLKVQQKERKKEMQALMEGRIEEYDKQNKRKQLPSGIQKRLRGLGYEGDMADIVIEGNERRKRKSLPKWDQALRKAQYGKALDIALAVTVSQPSSQYSETEKLTHNKQPPDPITVLTILTALQHRSALETALEKRDETTLQPILRWLIKHITDPRHVLLTSRVSMLVLDMYAENLGMSVVIDRLVERLHERVRGLVEGAQAAESTRGMLDMVVAGA